MGMTPEEIALENCRSRPTLNIKMFGSSIPGSNRTRLVGRTGGAARYPARTTVSRFRPPG
jgi:hypothetical protein